MSWLEVPLHDLCRPKQWPTIAVKNLSDDGYPVYGANGIIGFHSEYTHSEPVLLIGCRGSCGNVIITEPMSYCNGNAMALDELDTTRINLKYLYYFLKGRGFDDIISGSGQPQITQTNLRRVIVSCPPITKQERIVAILDKANEIERTAENSQEIHALLIESTFMEMFGEPAANPRQWDVKPLDDVLELITYGLTVRPKYHTDGIPLLAATQIKSGFVDIESAPKVSQKDFDLLRPKCKAHRGDVLFSKTGTIGSSAILLESENIAIAQNIARLVFDNSQIIPIFGLYYLRTNYIQTMSKHRAKGNTQKDLQLRDMKKFPIYVPPLELQHRFETIFKSTNELSHTVDEGVKKARTLVDSNLQSLMN